MKTLIKPMFLACVFTFSYSTSEPLLRSKEIILTRVTLQHQGARKVVHSLEDTQNPGLKEELLPALNEIVVRLCASALGLDDKQPIVELFKKVRLRYVNLDLHVYKIAGTDSTYRVILWDKGGTLCARKEVTEALFLTRDDVMDGQGKLSSLNGQPVERGKTIPMMIDLGIGDFTCGRYCVTTSAHLFVRFREEEKFEEVPGLPSRAPKKDAPASRLDGNSTVYLKIPENAESVEVYLFFDRWTTRPVFSNEGPYYEVYIGPVLDNFEGGYVSQFGENFKSSVR